nr:MAG TPA: hypothetical protein [Caudoviricetes sp.]
MHFCKTLSLGGFSYSGVPLRGGGSVPLITTTATTSAM